MKFLVLALCVCAASAASFGNYGANTGAYSGYSGFKPYSFSKAQVAPTAFSGAKAAASYTPFSVTPSSPAAPVVVEQVASVVPVPVVPAPVVPAPVVPVPVAKTYVSPTSIPVPVPASKNYLNSESEAQIVRQENDVSATGFQYGYETSNGIASQSSGELRKLGETESVVVKGSYQYISPEGIPILVTYIADENGFQPQSDVLPVAPEVPEAIARSLAFIAAQPKYVEPTKNY